MQKRFSLKKIKAYFYILSSLIIFFVACQRELSFERKPPSDGYFSKDSNGNCEPILVAGNYTTGILLNDSNYLQAEVNVTTPGTYSITTDTINGYYFKLDGTFTGTGLTNVKLPGYGTPVLNDSNYFTLKYNLSTCEALIIFSPDINNNPASFTFQGSPDSCMNDTLYGSYVPAALLNTENKISLSLNVTVPGKYAITTDTINGYSFSAAGTFQHTGIQTIFLIAAGTPVKTGTDIFTVNAGFSTCSFNVPVINITVITNNDYFPLSAFSKWTYDDLLNPGDSITKAVKGTSFITGNLYHVIEETDMHSGPFNFFYRKDGLKYFEYAAPNKFTTFFQYKNPVNADIFFLEENINTGSTWQTPEYVDTSTTGSILLLRYNFSCMDADATVTLNGKAFANVYKIKLLPFIKTGSNDFAATGEEYIIYYAKGIGMIYLKKTLSGFLQNELQIRSWIVN